MLSHWTAMNINSFTGPSITGSAGVSQKSFHPKSCSSSTALSIPLCSTVCSSSQELSLTATWALHFRPSKGETVSVSLQEVTHLTFCVLDLRSRTKMSPMWRNGSSSTTATFTVSCMVKLCTGSKIQDRVEELCARLMNIYKQATWKDINRRWFAHNHHKGTVSLRCEGA
jgi:hypothetical protein